QSAAGLIAESDLLLTAPRAALGDLPKHLKLRTLRCPIELPPIELELHTAQHLARDGAVCFFSSLLKKVLQAL
ncbi:MAG: hypothetical protein AAFQ77_03700, partial [Myxococcota bacterium]